MEVKQIKVSAIRPYAKNAKMHEVSQVENVAKSIKEFGFVQPIVIDKRGEIVIGHCRFLAAKRLGLETVPCVSVEGLTVKQVKRLRLLDNKLNESAWDVKALKEDSFDLDFSDFDLNGWLSGENEKAAARVWGLSAREKEIIGRLG